MTVEQYVRRCEEAGYSRGQARTDLRWDVARSFISVKLKSPKKNGPG